MMSQGNKPKTPGRRAEVAERISYNATAEPIDCIVGTEDALEQLDPLNHKDTMSMFMEQCCQPDIIEDHDTIHQSTTSGNKTSGNDEEEDEIDREWLVGGVRMV